ncbi:GIY-YIG nuclease family protein [Clostridium novyi]
MRDEILSIIGNLSEEHYNEIKNMLEKYNNKTPKEFYYKSSDHFYFTCRKYIMNKKLIDVRAIEVSLRSICDALYDFSFKNYNKISQRYLRYPTFCFTYLLKKSNDIEELYNAITYSKTILNDYKELISTDLDEIIDNAEEYEMYIDYKNLQNKSEFEPLIYMNKYWDSKNKIYKEYKREFIDNLVTLLNQSGLYKLYDEEKNLIYIGKSYDLGNRILSSINERKASYYDYCVINNKVDTDIYEIYYISKYKPVLNKVSKNDDKCTIKLEELKFSDIRYIF